MHIVGVDELEALTQRAVMLFDRLPKGRIGRVINNTPDPAFWQPIEEHYRTLGERFKFINANNVHGFKAGALRLALANTAADDENNRVHDAQHVARQVWLMGL